MNEAKSNEPRQFQAFGPWATALDTGPGAALSTFWRRRMAMVSTLTRDSGRASWRMRIVLMAGGLAVLALPSFYLSRAEVAQAEPPEIAEPADTASPATIPDSTPKVESPARIFPPTQAPATYEPQTNAIPEPSVEFFPEPTEAEKRINEALDKRATFDFVEMPLLDVAEFLKDQLGNEIEVQLDNRALEDAGAGSDTQVNLKAKNVPIRTALRLLLGELDLTYLIQDEVLLITTVDKSEMELFTRTYPVGDLVPNVPVAPTQRDFQTLARAITNTVRPQTWSEPGGPGSLLEVPVSSSLVISQTRDVHDEVLQLLRALRAAKRVSEAGGAD